MNSTRASGGMSRVYFSSLYQFKAFTSECQPFFFLRVYGSWCLDGEAGKRAMEVTASASEDLSSP